MINIKFYSLSYNSHDPSSDSSHRASENPQASQNCVAQVFFPEMGVTLACLNTDFILHIGDIVFVDGSYSGLRGQVVSINYDYTARTQISRRIRSVADTAIHGSLYISSSHFISFDRSVLPIHKLTSWFPTSFKKLSSGHKPPLDKRRAFIVSEAIAERGHEYYLQGRVVYLCIDHTQGYAIVEGGTVYEIEFIFSNGEIGSVKCSCPCAYNCKHGVALILQLKELIRQIEAEYADEYRHSEYFSAVSKRLFLSMVLDSKHSGLMVL